eukprot:8841361-Pyramimonas_sp.AAC.1
MLPDLPVLDHEQPTDTSYHSREQTIRWICIGAITQATAGAKTNRALRTKTTITGQRYYGEGYLVDLPSPYNREGRLGRLEWPVPSCKK